MKGGSKGEREWIFYKPLENGNHTEIGRAASRGENELTNFNCPIKTTSMWHKQGVFECFEVDSRVCHTSCTLSGLRPTTTLSPRQARAPDTPKSQNLMPLIYVPGQQNYQTQLHRTTPYHCRQYAHAGSRK